MDQMSVSTITHANPLPSMAEEVRKHSETLGETGKGLESEDKIIPGTEIARTWGESFCAAWYTI